MSKQICFRDIDPLKRRQLIDRHRQLNRRITRATLGSFISSALAIFMPWNLLSVGINLVSLAKNVNQFLDLQKELALAGIKVGKRVIMEGFIQGVVVKLATTILLFGHDDLVLASGVMDHWIYEAGSLIANHTSLVFDGPTWSTQGLVQEDEIHRMSHAFIQEASGLAGLPAETMQQALGLQTAAELHAQGITEAVGLFLSLVFGRVTYTDCFCSGTPRPNN